MYACQLWWKVKEFGIKRLQVAYNNTYGQWRSYSVGCPGRPLSLAPPKPIKRCIAEWLAL